MPICPSGHTSESADFCDVCGDLIAGAPRVRLEPDEPGPPPAEEREPAEVCPLCGTPRSGRFCEVDAYAFESGGAAGTGRPPAPAAPPAPGPPPPPAAPPAPGQPPAPAAPPASGQPFAPTTPPAPGKTGGADPPGWRVTIIADRAYYDSVVALGGEDAASIAFPPYCPERRIELAGEQIRIGRRSPSRGIEPEIDLSVPPEDPGVSHVHAALLAQPDGTWVLVDPGSMNGTTLNGGTKPLDVNVAVPVGDGDRIHIGAWTTIVLSPGGGTPGGPPGGAPT